MMIKYIENDFQYIDDGDDNDGINGIINGSVTATLWKVTYYDSFE